MRRPLLALLSFGSGVAFADPPLEALQIDAEAARLAAGPVQPAPAPPDDGFRFVGLLQTRAIANNIVTTSPFLDGQVVGDLGGSNGTLVLPEDGLDLDADGELDEDLVGSRFVEQRATGFFTYAPPILDGRMALTAAFEVDFLWGDRSYGTGGNTGGGIGADQVNLQTRRLHGSFKPRLGEKHELTLVAGLQFLADGAYNPATSGLDELSRTGGGLRFWGTEAAGLSAFGRLHDRSGDRMRYRLGAYSLYENGVGTRDDAVLYAADLDILTDWRSRIGLHAWVLRDYTGGVGGLLGLGPTSQLSALQGGPALDLRSGPDADPVETDADIAWLALDAGFNHRLDRGPLGATALAAYNIGKLYVLGQEDVLVRGWLLDGELRFRWAPGGGSILRAEALATSRDGSGREAYTGLLTGNSYGIVGAVYATHGMLLLFQDPFAINRSTPVIFDVSNGGDGLVALTASAGWDVIPHRLTIQAGAGHARDGQAEPLGTEINARLITHPWFGTSLGLAGATLSGSRFEVKPWMAMLHLEALLF